MAKEVTTKKLLEEIIEGIRNRKGERIVQIDLRKIKEAPAAEVDDHVRTVTHVHPLSHVGEDNAEWIALDYGTVFVHIMQREPRAYYDLEHLWADGTIKEIES